MSSKTVITFGPFELLAEPSTLHRKGRPVAITPKALATLAALVSRPGAAVSKSELLATVWPDTVVEEANLSQNIYTLRKLLGPDFPDQNAIENIPRFGYRFNLPVSEGPAMRADTKELQAVETAKPEGSPLSNGGDWVPEARVPEAIRAPASPPAAEDRQTAGEPAVVPAIPTASAKPGTRKFVWALAVAAGLVLAGLLYRQWPGLASIAGRTPKYEEARFTSNSDEDRVTAAALSPDGKLVAYADADGVVLRGTSDATLHYLPSPKMEGVDRLSWFPDQLHLVLSGDNAATKEAQIWKVSVLGEPPVLLRDEARLGVPSHTGSSVAFTTADGKGAWVMGTAGENARQVVAADAGENFSILMWAPHDDGLLLERRTPATPVGAGSKAQELMSGPGATYERVDLRSGQPTAVNANFAMGDACLTSDSTLIYSPVGAEVGRESTSLRTVRLDPVSGKIISPPTSVFDATHGHIYEFTCASNGDRIAVLRRSGDFSVYVGVLGSDDAGLTDVRRLSLDSEAAYPHGWSSDSKSVLYEAKRSDDHWQIYSQAMNRHDPEPIMPTSGRQSRPVLTPDHRWLLFANQAVPNAKWDLYRMSPQGGSLELIPSQENLQNFRCPVATGSCVVRISAPNGQGVYSVLDPLLGKGRVLFTEPPNWRPTKDWDISPDGSTLVVDVASPGNVPLHTISLTTGSIKDIAYQSSFRTTAVNWASDGKGFFVADSTPSGSTIVSNLSYVDLNGRSNLLRVTSGLTWAVPSPDGKLLAFVDRSLDSNVWLLQAR